MLESHSGNTATFIYNDAGRLVTRTDPVGVATYTHDNNGNVLTVTENGKVLTRVYDELDRVTSFTDGEGNTFGYTYDENGNLLTLTYPGGTKTVTYTYDPLNRLKTVTDWNNRLTTYTWDDDGRLTLVERPNGTTRQMDYDAANRLTRMQERNANGVLLAFYEFGYDPAGKIEEVFSLPKPGGGNVSTFTALYDLDNRLETFNGLNVVYDDDGNMTFGPLMDNGFVTYTYDARNRLVSAGAVTYTYDAEGNRIAFTTTEGTTKLAVDPHGALSRVLVRERPDGTKTFYVYGLTLLYEVDELEAIRTYHFNQVGSTVALVAADGLTVTDRVEYSPYGQILTRTGNTDTPFLYNGVYGVQTDPNGLLSMRARYYNPHLRRFLNADPIGFDGGLNWYAYANGNPIIQSDSSGLWFGIDDAIFAGVGAVVGIAGRAVGDLVTGHRSTWEDYVGAAVGGAVAGETLLYTANPFLAGAAGGAVANLTTQALKVHVTGKQESWNGASIVVDAGLGAATGFIPGRPRISGVNAGRGSDVQVFRQVLTKANNGTISSIKPETAVRMAQGAFYEYAVPQGAAASTIGSTLLWGGTGSGPKSRK